jgi:hypothetical protein
LRQLPLEEQDSELVERLIQHDSQLYSISSTTYTPSVLFNTSVDMASARPLHLLPPESQHRSPRPTISRMPSESHRRRSATALDLPVELLADILDRTGDWALARAVGLPTSLVPPLEWTNPSPTDAAILAGYLPLIRAADPVTHPPTKAGVEVAIRFGYVYVLDHLRVHARTALLDVANGPLIPNVASMHDRVHVLRWWARHVGDVFPPPHARHRASAVDEAASAGHIDVLHWWWAQRSRPGWSFEYTESALEGASRRGRLIVLDWFRARHVSDRLVLRAGRAVDAASAAGRLDALGWWARSSLELSYDRGPLRHASVHGRTDVLRWWAESGLQLVYDAEVLVGATRHDQPDVLEWWDHSGLTVQYRLCDIEEALEDAIGGGERAREWWKRKGVDFNANDKEWTKMQSLN